VFGGGGATGDFKFFGGFLELASDGGGTPPGVPSIPARIMRVVGSLGGGAFGTVDLVDIRGVIYAAKRTSTHSRDGKALARELAIYNRVHRQPHPHITPLYGVCTDHGDGLVRLVMRRAVCSLEELLREARGQVGGWMLLFAVLCPLSPSTLA